MKTKMIYALFFGSSKQPSRAILKREQFLHPKIRYLKPHCSFLSPFKDAKNTPIEISITETKKDATEVSQEKLPLTRG
ncbi:hypothetical protein [Persephonella sp.]